MRAKVRSPLPNEEIIRRVAYLPPSRSFRSAFQYQTIMFMAAGEAVASASGRSCTTIRASIS